MNPYVSTIFTLLLIHRAHSRSSLTPPAILAATITALIHASHPTALPFTLLISFYLLGTTATKVKKHEKAKLTISSAGGHGEHSGRGVIQVLANSAVASLLALVDLGIRKGWLREIALQVAGKGGDKNMLSGRGWFGGETGWVGDVLMIGIIVNYASTTADTLSSELGILSKTKPRLILNPLKECAPGTNGGVSLTGLVAGGSGALIIGGISSYWFNPTASSATTTTYFIFFTTILGLFGSILDSLLGAIFQLSVIDLRTNLIVENPYGGQVLIVPGETSFHPHQAYQIGRNDKIEIEKVGGEGARGDVEVKKDKSLNGKENARGGASRKLVQGGLGWLDNNGVNFTMAGMMSVVGMVTWKAFVFESIPH